VVKKNPELQEENLVERHYARIINESQSTGAQLATAMEGSFIGKRGKQLSQAW
jgi:hypothetical protein